MALLNGADRQLQHRVDQESRQASCSMVCVHWLQGGSRTVSAKSVVQGLLVTKLAGDCASATVMELLYGVSLQAPPEHRFTVYAH